MEQVQWKVKGIFKADAQKCYEEIGDGDCTPQDILNKARDENSELHKCFEWDDSIAAEKYRLSQARQVIQFLVIVPKKEEDTPTRVFQISSERTVYKPTRTFLTNQDEYQSLLNRAKAELVAIRNRYEQLAELETVFDAIDSL